MAERAVGHFAIGFGEKLKDEAVTAVPEYAAGKMAVVATCAVGHRFRNGIGMKERRKTQ